MRGAEKSISTERLKKTAVSVFLVLLALSALVKVGVSEGRDFNINTTPQEGSTVTSFPTAIWYHAYRSEFRDMDMNNFFNHGVYNDIYGSGSFTYTIQSAKVPSFRLEAVVHCEYTEEGDEWVAYVILYPQNLPELKNFPDGSYTVTLKWSGGSDSFSFVFKNDAYTGINDSSHEAPPPDTTPQAVKPMEIESSGGIPGVVYVAPETGQAGEGNTGRTTTPIVTGPLAWLYNIGGGVRVYDRYGNLLPAGSSLEPGCTIVTDGNSTAQLQYQNGTSCNVGYETSVTVKSFPGQAGEGSSYDLACGSFEVVSAGTHGGGTTTVNGGGITSILGVRGTVYEVALTPEGNMEIRLYEGTVGVRSGSAQSDTLSEEVVLEQGTYLVVNPEGVPTDPMALSDSHYEWASSMYGTPLARPGAAGAAAEAPSPGTRVPGWAWFLMGLGGALILALAALSATLLARRPKAGA
jgi:hypothetical protein